MKKLKMFLALLLALAMVMSMVACGGSSAGKDTEPAGTKAPAADNKDDAADDTTAEVSILNLDSMFPIVNKSVELEICLKYDPSMIENPEELWFWRWIEEKSGLDIKLRAIASDVWEEQLTIMLSSGDLPDIILNSFTTQKISEYAEKDGLFIAMNDYINDAELMPNLSALFAERKDALAASTLPSGNIYGLPSVTDLRVAANNVSSHRAIWAAAALEQIGVKMEEIKTLDDLYEVFVALRDSDYNGNGVADEIPWSTYWGTDGKNGMSDLVSFILNAYGVVNNDGLIGVNYNTGKAGYTALMDEYKETVEFLKKLYDEKLLDPDLFAQTEIDMAAKAAEDKLAFTTYWNPGMCTNPELWSKYVESKYADNSIYEWQQTLVSKDGDTPRTYGADLVSSNTFVVTKDCEIPEIAMRFADAFYDPLVALYFVFGPEYMSEDDSDGIGWAWLPDLTSTSNYDEAREAAGVYDTVDSWTWLCSKITTTGVWTFGLDHYPGMSLLHPEYNTSEKAKETDWTRRYKEVITPNEVAGYPSTIYYSAEETEIIDTYKMALDEYVIQMTAKFISGVEPMQNWDAFQNQLKALNVEDYNNVYETTYDVYVSNMK